MPSIDEALSLLLHFLEKQQTNHGGFISLVGDTDFKKDTHEHHTVFHTSLILLCLAGIKDHKIVKKIAKKSIAFLIHEKNENWTWNYLTRKEALAKKYPPDWDDTACALAAISIYKPTLITGSVLRTITELLIQTEIETGGPYPTWIVSKNIQSKWNDIDIVVNSNISFFLKLHGISLPKIIKYTETSIEAGTFPSKYYFSSITSLYFISRFYNGAIKEIAIKRILEHQKHDGLWANDLETALAVSVLIRYDAPLSTIEKSVNHLLSISLRQSWQPHALYIEEINNDVPTYSSSAALTAALCGEALILYDYAQSKEKQPPNTCAPKLHNEIIAKTLSYFSTDQYLHTKASQYISHLTKKDRGNEITLLPYHFFSSLPVTLSKTISEKLIIDLGTTNLLGWLAYRIYDDLLDDEGHPEDIPLANIALRRLTTIYHTALAPKHYTMFQEIMDRIEHANVWERLNCRINIKDSDTFEIKEIPLYKNHHILADKSIGHALGPLTILLKAGFTIQSPEIKQTLAFFHHYIIARQLNDDAHDWLADLERGFLNSSSVEIFKTYTKQHSQKTMTFNLQQSKQELQSIFWNVTILTISNYIFKHIEKAQHVLHSNSALQDTLYLEQLLTPIIQATKKAVATRKQMLDFLGK